MRFAATVSCTLGLVVAAFASAAERVVDFSGDWSTESAADADAQYRANGSGWGSRITIKQENGRLTVEYPFFARGDLQPPLVFSYAPDGEATVNRVTMGRGVQTQTSTARWSDERLIITTRHSFDLDGARVESEVTQTLWLESPTTLVVESTRAAAPGGPAATNRTVYRKA